MSDCPYFNLELFANMDDGSTVWRDKLNNIDYICIGGNFEDMPRLCWGIKTKGIYNAMV